MLKDYPTCSYSSLSMYASCPLSYKYRYIDKIEEKAADYTGTIPGLIAHKLAEYFFALKDEGKICWEVFEDRFEEVFTKYINSKAVYLGRGKFATSIEDARNKCHLWSLNLRDELQRNGLVQKVSISEKRWAWQKPAQVSSKIKFIGGFDLFSAESENHYGRMVDFKASDSNFHINFKQVFLYATVAKRVLGLKTSLCGFLLFKGGKTEWRRFSDETEDETIAWAENILDRIVQEQFEPTPSVPSCRFCPFACELRQKAKDIEEPFSLPPTKGNLVLTPNIEL